MSRVVTTHAVPAGQTAHRGARAGTISSEYPLGEMPVAHSVVAVLGGRYSAGLGHVPSADLIAMLDAGGYARYDLRTATRLLQLCEIIDDRYDGQAGLIGRRFAAYPELRAALDALPGWGPVTVRLFLRELRGVWPGAGPPLDERAATGEAHVPVPPGTQPGDMLPVKGKGLPRFRGHGRGSLNVTVIVDIPRRLSPRQRQLYEQLRAEAAGAADQSGPSA